MSIAEIFHRLQGRLLAQPLWLEWLSMPLSVRDAHRKFAASFLLRQLPCTAVLAFIYVVAKQLGAFEVQPLVGVWLSFMAMVPLFWPVPLLRIGLASCKAASEPGVAIASRLHAVAALSFLLVLVMAVVFGAIVWFLLVVSRASILSQ